MVRMADQKAIVAKVTGRVQGVGYRYAVVHIAVEYGLEGWVRNRPDGSVEVWAQGDEAVLTELVTFLWEGPRSARVAGVDVRSADPDGSLREFVVRS
jgi:acylphosphatase